LVTLDVVGHLNVSYLGTETIATPTGMPIDVRPGDYQTMDAEFKAIQAKIKEYSLKSKIY